VFECRDQTSLLAQLVEIPFQFWDKERWMVVMLLPQLVLSESASSTGSFGLFSGDHHFRNRYCYCYILDVVSPFLLVGKNTKKSVMQVTLIDFVVA